MPQSGVVAPRLDARRLIYDPFDAAAYRRGHLPGYCFVSQPLSFVAFEKSNVQIIVLTTEFFQLFPGCAVCLSWS